MDRFLSLSLFPLVGFSWDFSWGSFSVGEGGSEVSFLLIVACLGGSGGAFFADTFSEESNIKYKDVS